MGVIKISLVLLVAILSSACRGTAPVKLDETSYSWSVNQLVISAKEKSKLAQESTKRTDKLKLTSEGIEISNRCIMKAPEEAGCYYWHAVNTGLYYEVKIIGYQTGVKTMIFDCNKVIELNEKYDHGGAYRILGELYTRLPQTTAHPNDIARDLQKAEDYLKMAIRVAGNYPENYLLLSENFVAQGKLKEALDALITAQQLIPQWKKDKSYDSWLTTRDKLEKKLDSNRKESR